MLFVQSSVNDVIAPTFKEPASHGAQLRICMEQRAGWRLCAAGPAAVMACGQNIAVVASVSLGWTNITNTAVPMLEVVPVDEMCSPGGQRPGR